MMEPRFDSSRSTGPDGTGISAITWPGGRWAGQEVAIGESWRPSVTEVDELVGATLRLPSSERAAFIQAACGDDRALLDDVQSLVLAAMNMSHDFLDGSARRLAEPPHSEPEHSLQVGDRLGPYRLIRVLGEGGMGKVLLGERADGEIEQRVAVKVLAAGRRQPALYQRFRSERQILAQLDHPNIARLLDAGTTTEGCSYLIMDWVDGIPIDRYCAVSGLDLKPRLELFRKVCSAVAHAHQQRIVHRDLKPSNILVDRQGEPKLLDFGIAKLLDPASFPLPVPEATSVQQPMTPAWASPEQLQGVPATTATDVYALGLLLHHMLTGQLPYAPEITPPGVRLRQILDGETLVRPSDIAALHEPRMAFHLRGDLDNIVAKTLRIEPEQRYESVTALDEDVHRFLAGETVRAARGAWNYRTRKVWTRCRWHVATLLLILAISVCALVKMQRQSDRLASERHRTQSERERATKEARSKELANDLLLDLLYSLKRDDGKTAGKLAALASARQFVEQATVDDDPQIRAHLYQVLGQAYWLLDEHALAVQMVELAISKSGSSTGLYELWSQHGDLLTDLGQFSNAIDSYRQASRWLSDEDLLRRLEVLGETASGHYHLGNLQMATDDMAAAMTLLDLRISPRSIPLEGVINFYGSLLEATGRVTESLDIGLDVYTRLESRSMGHLVDLAFLLAHSGEVQRAVEVQEAVVGVSVSELDPKCHAACTRLRQLGYLYGVAGRLEDASRAFELALVTCRRYLEAQPAEIRARYNLAMTKVRQAQVQRLTAPRTTRAALGPVLTELAMLRAEEPILFVENAYVMALILAGRLDEARPWVLRLLESGWQRPDFLALARDHDLLPKTVPPPPVIDPLPPKVMRVLLADPIARPAPWDDPELRIAAGDDLLGRATEWVHGQIGSDRSRTREWRAGVRVSG